MKGDNELDAVPNIRSVKHCTFLLLSVRGDSLILIRFRTADV